MADVWHFPYEVDRREIAARLRALLAPSLAPNRIQVLAARLNVNVRALRASIDHGDPHPSSVVVLAVVQHYGVDPTWLLTGEYNSATHREALEDPDSVLRLLARTALRDSLIDRTTLIDFGLRDSSRIDDRRRRGD